MCATKIDSIIHFLADFFKSLPFPRQGVFRLVPFGSGGLQVFLNVFGNLIRVNQPVADKQRVTFHCFRMFENDDIEFAVLDVH